MTDLTLLVKRARSGDSEAFAALYALYAHDLYRFAANTLNSPDDAEDAVQDALLTAFRAIASLRKPEAFKSWLFKILMNRCKTMLCERGKSPDLLPDEDYFFSLKDDSLSDAGICLELQEAIRSLPPPDGQLVLLSVIGGFKSHELAEIYELPAATVRSKVSRSLAKLRCLLTYER